MVATPIGCARCGYLPETLVTEVRLTHPPSVGNNPTTSLTFTRTSSPHAVRDTSGAPGEVRLFFHHDFYISESEVGNTAYFDPDEKALIHYKGRRYFLISTDSPEGVETFATGRKAFHGQEGTWRDAEDGVLSDHAITEGSVDSTIGHTLRVEPMGTAEAFYWMAVGKTHGEIAG